MTRNSPEVAEVNFPSEAVSVYAPTVSRVISLKVATPATAATVFVPPMVAPPGPEVIESVTLEVSVVITFP